jgi:hypothetical protein
VYFPGAKRVFYLSPEEQERLPFASLAHVPWNHFARKNIGYLVASALGAETIYDTDDDNLLEASPPLLHGSAQMLPVRQLVTVNNSVANIYTPFRHNSAASEIWPRGTPLNIAANGTSKTTLSNVASERLVIQQSLVNQDPDVDAIYRMGMGIPEQGIVFDASGLPVVLERGTPAPTNSQATTFMKDVFPLMLLPASVHPRVSDIWRGYFALPILWARNLTVAYVAPRVKQVRNEHDEKEDLWAEWPLYHKAGALATHVADYASSADISVAEASYQLYVDMYERGLIEASDVHLCKAFMEDISTTPMFDVSYSG